MCGINGIFSLGDYPIDRAKIGLNLEKMNSKLIHRGPDDNDIWLHERIPIGVAQSRLSILDLSSAGHQPMLDTTNRNLITYNGEIFNFRQLNKDYLRGEKFHSGTDTETILKMYRKFGLEMLTKLNGMFAFALWDEKKQELIIARDKSGKKPLYYTEQSGRFCFASELKALFELDWVNREIDEKVLYDFLTYDLVPPPNTMFKNIFKFKPGHFMRINTKGIIDYKPYFELKKKSLQFETESQLADLIFNQFDSSVKDRMISDVPVGAFLSGGVDSSAVVALMRKNTKQNIKTFTIGFEGQPNYDEVHHAEKVSKLFDTDHHVKIVKPQDLIEVLPTIVEIYDEPQADTTSIPIYFLSQLASEQGIKVVLNGDGPDEVFAGYTNFIRNYKWFPYFKMLSTLPHPILSAGHSLVSRFNNGHAAFEMFSRLKEGREFYWPGAQSIKESDKRNKLDSGLLQRVGSHSSYDYVDQLLDKYRVFNPKANEGKITDIIEWMSFSGFVHADIERFLYRSDRLGMAHSIESRSPFLNIDMVEMGLSVPSEFKIRNGEAKYILKKAFERILPHDVLYRKKMGFVLPIREWGASTLVDNIERNLDSFISNYGVFNKNTLKDELASFKRGNKNLTNTIWTTYFLMNWFKKWS
ncbi:asparagine synthase (glutamine-hydrolyzing) [Schleiferiaceae bacterium]|jgi:asparagine synthase (glutamine-hydrolysing)|nr:asparagine synthase (glutamine-hydrolyzing) [Schleiferiaceae bacterium]